MAKVSVAQWIKSTRSGSDGECVEIARGADGVAVRDSKDPDGPILTFDATAWRAFVADVKRGGFDGADAEPAQRECDEDQSWAKLLG